MLKKSLVLACFSVVLCGAARAEQDTVVINITSKISVDVDKGIEENLLNAVKEYSKKITKDLSGLSRSVTEVETTVDSDCGSICKREIIRCSECGSDKSELTTTQVETKCSCGKPVKSCSTCGKCSSSCSSCCK